MDLGDAVVVVVGGAGGLGGHVCRAFAREGTRVAVADRERLDQAGTARDELTSLGAPATLTVPVELTDLASIKAMLGRVVDAWGRVDVLVNAAGVNKWIAFDDLDSMTPELWDMLLRVNLTGPFLCARAVAPIMRRQGNGRIVNIVSTAGLRAGGSSIAYAVAKAGLAHLTRCLAVGLGPEVLVNGVSPGMMEGTYMSQALTAEQLAAFRDQVALKRTPDLDDIAAQVVTFARTDSTTGQNIAVDAGLTFW
ncbi:MAG: SDR family oxidoreductase [Chloroflexota bacterium]|nr:SDR family oxidoreductase [Chloroflexota bacterium]